MLFQKFTTFKRKFRKFFYDLGFYRSAAAFAIIFIAIPIIFSLVTNYLVKGRLDIRQKASTEWNFITRQGNKLYDGTMPFRFAGSNMHWLGLSDANKYPSHFEIDNAMETAAEMGASVVRSHTLGISVGDTSSIEPSLNQFNDRAFESIDYAIKSARQNNVRLIIPLVDNWQYYFGGKSTFTNWRGLTNSDEFFTNPTVIQDFKNYISHILNHVNQYTGVALKDDPTILAWETGNELNTNTIAWDNNWTENIASYIKSTDKNHLVADGRESSPNNGHHIDLNQLRLPSVDMYSNHFYPVDSNWTKQDALLTAQNNKVYFIGEYDSANASSVGGEGTIEQDKINKVLGTASVLIKITQNNVKNAWYVQLLQSGFSLTQGQTYTVSFYAKADSSRNIDVGLQKAYSPYSMYLEKTIQITNVWTKYQVTYTAVGNETNAMVEFNLAETKGNVWLDDVRLISSSSTTNMLKNGSFEYVNTTGQLFQDWIFKTKPNSQMLDTFLPEVQSIPENSGTLFWELWGHANLYGYSANGFLDQHYPGDNLDMEESMRLIRNHIYNMRSLPIPPSKVTASPLLHRVKNASNGKILEWRGVVAAKSYNIERSSDGINFSIIAKEITDQNVPYTDTTADPNTIYYYRLQGVNMDGVLGAYSNTEPEAGGIIQNGSFEHDGNYWKLPWTLDVKTGTSAIYSQDSIEKIQGNYSLKTNITQASSNVWYVQVSQSDFPIQSGQTYKISFKAKADKIRNIDISLQQSGSPYAYYYGKTVSLTTNWQQFDCSYQATASQTNTALRFNLAQTTGNVWIDDVKLSKGIGVTNNCVNSWIITPTDTQLTPTTIVPTNTPVLTLTPTFPLPTSTPTSTSAPTVILTPTNTPVPTTPPVTSGVMTVSSISMSYSTSGANKTIYATTKVINTVNNQAVSSSNVLATLKTPSGKTSSQTKTTNSSGDASFSWKFKEKGNYTLTITNVTKSGFTYTPTITTKTLTVN